MLRWLSRIFKKSPQDHVVSVDFDHSGVSWKLANGHHESILWSELQRVSVRTLDCGPFAEDVYLVLYYGDTSCCIPQCASDAIFAHMQQMPDFGNEKFIEAMGCVENREFVCWKRRD